MASVQAGLVALKAAGIDDSDWVMVHDAARPCITVADIEKLYTTVTTHKKAVGGILALPIADTMKVATADMYIASTLPRENLWRALTPQMFRIGALSEAMDTDITYSDEAGAVEALQQPIIMVEGRADNIKVTVPSDFPLAEAILTTCRTPHTAIQGQNNMRIGHGYDIHKMGPGSYVTLGGVEIPHTQGVVAHSDGDVLIHALCDALLGAIGLGDIGHHFPDTDMQYKGKASTFFLQTVMGLVKARGYAVENADMTIIAEAPKIAPHIQPMRQILAHLLLISPEQVNIKATTAEGLGAIGRKEGIAVHVVVLLANP